MKTDLKHKSTTAEIRQRFDVDVERFSCLATGQTATMDAPLVLELVAKAAARHLQAGSTILDLGCGAGNFTLRVLQETGGLHCHLADLSAPMLERAAARVGAAGAASVRTTQGDLRDLDVAPASVDAILAGAVLHHLREDADWQAVYRRLCTWLRPGGRLYVADLADYDEPTVQALMWERYGDYLAGLGGAEYRDKVLAYIEKEDSPRSLAFQLRMLSESGFSAGEVLHRQCVFACYYGVK